MLFNIASLVAVALAAATATSSVEAKPTSNGNCHFDNLLVFGDSYSDIGNVYKLSNKAWPLKTYDHGRFSNGPVWSEHVCPSLFLFDVAGHSFKYFLHCLYDSFVTMLIFFL